jgi:hypothetical protein
LKKNSAAMLISIVFFSCGSGILDRTPAARVGDDIISRGFLRYTMEKLSVKGGTPARGEIRDAIIRNSLIARKAAAVKAGDSAAFRAEYRRVMDRTVKEFLCETLKARGDCDDALYGMLAKEFSLTVPAIEWEKVFTKQERPFIPLGGRIPARAPDRPGAPERGINSDYAAGIRISAGGTITTLADVLLQADDSAYLLMQDEAGAGRDRTLRSILAGQFLEKLKGLLGGGERALLGEVERRAGDNLLAEEYRRVIGFENITGGRSSAVVYAVSDEEALQFYRDNPRLFEEPVSVELSHIRVRDFALAEKIYRGLLSDPASFCTKAGKYSIAGDAASCGYIGTVARGTNLPLYREFGFTLSKEGQVSVPFRTPAGVEILKLHHRIVRLRPFDAYTAGLAKEKLQRVKREERLERDIAEIKRKYPVAIYD